VKEEGKKDQHEVGERKDIENTKSNERRHRKRESAEIDSDRHLTEKRVSGR
jgi:hypothetical protein